MENKKKSRGEYIKIHTDGRDTIARLYDDNAFCKFLGEAVARCHPDDEFDLATGAKLALDRLFAIISQCGENELKTLCRIISEVNEVYATGAIPETVKRQPRRGRIAEDYATLHKKMCDSQEKCAECPLWDADCKRCRDYGAVAGELLETVFQWTEKRPAKTRSQVFLEQYPNAKTENGIPIICPPSVDGNEKCAGNACRSCLDKYWNAEHKG